MHRNFLKYLQGSASRRYLVLGTWYLDADATFAPSGDAKLTADPACRFAVGSPRYRSQYRYIA
jgi:hypothetical protein